MSDTPDPYLDGEQAVTDLAGKKLDTSTGVSNPPKSPDQVDALDAILNDVLPDSWGDQKITRKDAKAKLLALLVEARIDELKRLPDFRDVYLASEYIAFRIKELQQGALAHADSLPASGKQADKSVVRELLRLRKLYDRYELEDTADHDGNALATWSGYKAFRNPISDRIEEITGVRSDQEVAEWLSQRLPGAVGDDKSSKNASSEELEKQREVTK